MKYKVILVDDEQWIRKWLKKMIENSKQNLEIVGLFDNPVDALKYLKDNSVDIVITDICMPMMLGIDFIEEIQKEGIRSEFILISGYSEFDYAKKAFSLNILDYLLKPIEKTELFAVLDKAVDNIHKKKMNRMITDIAGYSIRSMLRNYINHENTDDKQLEELIYSNGNDHVKFLIGCVQKKNLTEMIDEKEDITNKISECFQKDRIYVIEKNKLLYYFFTIVDEKRGISDEDWVEFKLKKVFSEYDVLISKWFYLISELEDHLIELQKKLVNRNISVNEVKDRRIDVIWKDIIADIRSGSIEGIREKVQRLQEQCSTKNMDIRKYRIYFFEIIGDVIKILEETETPDSTAIIMEGYEFSILVSEYHNTDSMFAWLKEYVSKAAKYRNSQKGESVSDMIRNACRYIFDNYQNDISATEICSYYHVSNTYFSRKFKEETGINFSDMITNVRLDVARRLLENSTDSIREIAEKCGFLDPKYFSRVFVLKEGCKPSEYRKKMKKNEDA